MCKGLIDIPVDWYWVPWTWVSCQATWVQGHQRASYHPSSARGEAPSHWPGFLQLPPNSSVHLFLLPLPLSSLTAVVGAASLIYLLRCSTDKICAEARIASSLLCRHICLPHFNCSTDSPNQYSTAVLCFSDWNHLLCVPPAKPKSHRQALVWRQDTLPPSLAPMAPCS